MSEPVVLINSFEVPAADAAAFIAAWENTRDYLQTQPGYIDTTLHQSLASDAEFGFVNIAHWRSPADFAAAIQSQGMREAAVGLAGYRPHASLYQVIRT